MTYYCMIWVYKLFLIPAIISFRQNMFIILQKKELFETFIETSSFNHFDKLIAVKLF